MNRSNKAISKDFTRPDETRPFTGHGHLDLINLDNEMSVGRAIFEPGWRWSNDIKPIAETESCEAEHFGYCLKGSMIVRMNDGQEVRITAGQAFHLPPGHDAWVVGNEPCEMIDFGGFREYAMRRTMRKAA